MTGQLGVVTVHGMDQWRYAILVAEWRLLLTETQFLLHKLESGLEGKPDQSRGAEAASGGTESGT